MRGLCKGHEVRAFCTADAYDGKGATGMTDFSKKANAMMARIESAVNQAMAGEMAEHVKAAVSAETFETVYPAYAPAQYVRRKTHGGIADPREYEVTMDNATHTLTVSDNREEAEIVESGIGYDWIYSRIYAMQPFPRPYFKNAEEKLVASGELHLIIQKALDAIDR